jgi:hypothetical protein
VLEEFVRFDQTISGASLASRNALLSLLEDAKKDPLPYDRLLVDDTSRIARNIEDALHLSDLLRFNGVGVTAISQGIDSQQKSARSLLALHGIIDEQYLTGLAEKSSPGTGGPRVKGPAPRKAVLWLSQRADRGSDPTCKVWPTGCHRCASRDRSRAGIHRSTDISRVRGRFQFGCSCKATVRRWNSVTAAVTDP